MSQKIPCELIQDLLPSYADGLTSEVSGREIEEHLLTCRECRCRYEALHIPSEEGKKETQSSNRKEIDYLKKVRNKNRAKIAAGIIGTIMILALAVFFKLFVTGSPSSGYEPEISVDQGQVQIKGTLTDSAAAFVKCGLVSEGEKKRLVVYTALPSFWNKNGDFSTGYSLEEIGKGLLINGNEVMPDGSVISSKAAELFEEKNPYIGDMPANGRIAQTLGISDDLGGFQNSLQTTEEPYGWTLEFKDPVTGSGEELFRSRMEAYSCVLLALIDNAGEISWTYQAETEDGVHERNGSVTASIASQRLGKDIKSFSGSRKQVQELLDELGIR
ncbi:DUF4825 domain-containing protein [Lacrimispora sp. NSJ-141]|uniref:DUF4825 domain-containing protein n=1 Tax=Lientehia hominis TaxID=2897778 RepID=A0AAP2RIX3_9FIRM|nr:DUF4825 domain-containing protein [Lientehia hominis]MCD2493049.1 DUF4825 domain-containing protein [Lientehia hominis]